MNSLEHHETIDEKFPGIYRGIVQVNDDPEQLRRVKVRVRGIFDEPVKKDHIPWAIPLVRDPEIPELGSECAVMFQDGDVGQPVFLPVQWLGVLNIDRLKSVYSKMVQKKTDNRETGIDTAGESWDEPETQSNAEDLSYTKSLDVIPQDVAKESNEEVTLGEPQSGIILEKSSVKDKEITSEMHPSGTYTEVQKDGGKIEHIEAQKTQIVKGNKKVLVKGNLLQKVLGYVKKQITGAYTLKIEGAVSLEINGAEITVDASGNVTVDSKTGTVQVKGQQFRVDGTVVPDGTGPWCGIPFCVFSGAPQTGKISVNN